MAFWVLGAATVGTIWWTESERSKEQAALKAVLDRSRRDLAQQDMVQQGIVHEPS